MKPGDRLGPYEILAPIGAGGMGEVYKARDTRLDRIVAIKTSAAQFTERFEREARAIAALNHPHICALYDVGPDYLVMELVEGSTLAARIAADRLPPAEALETARQIADALEAAHEKGIMHRDLKPANVKITPDGVVKVLDFGLAKTVETASPTGADATKSPTLTISPTRAGTILGTAAYMSPEQARGSVVDRRSDIWSFGVVLYEMLAGKPAFTGETVSDILAGVLRAEPDWSALPHDTPPRIRKLLRRCLERDRKQRLQAIGEARIAIDAPEEAVAQPGRSRPWPWVVAALLAIIAAVGWWRAARSAPSRSMVQLSATLPPGTTVQRVTTNHVAPSPDGARLVVLQRDMGGKTRLTSRRLEQSEFSPLPATEGARSPFFSPEGEWIGFFADNKLKKIAVQGGSPVTLCEAPGPFGASWGDDGNIVVAFNLGTTGLVRVPSAGGTPTAIQFSKLKGETAYAWPQVLPRSQAVLFTAAGPGGYEDANIDVFSFQTGQRKTLQRGGYFGRYLPSGHLLFMHQNTLFAAPFDLGRLAVTGATQPVLEDVSSSSLFGSANFDFSQTGTFVYMSWKGEVPWSFFWLDSAGNTQRLHIPPGFYHMPHLSPDGKRLAFLANDRGTYSSVWVQDLERDTRSLLTHLPGLNHHPVWTPDGKNIFFQSLLQPKPGLYRIRTDAGGEEQRLTEGGETPYSFSPDGKRLAYSHRGTNGQLEIWTAPIEGGPENPRPGKPEPFLRTPFSLTAPSFSPDGRWLAYQSNETGTNEVYVQPFPGPGAKSQISTGGGFDPIWSRNARGARGEIFFLALDGRIMAADYTTSHDSFLAGKPRVWSQNSLPYLGVFLPFDLAPHGKRFVVALYPGRTAEELAPIDTVTVLLNFFDELRRRVNVGGQMSLLSRPFQPLDSSR
jgi:serine/threonine-protein kinase